MPTKHLFPPPFALLFPVLALLALGAVPLSAEDVYVTGWVGAGINGCPPSCPYDLGTSAYSASVSTACPVGRTRTVFGAATNAGWAVTPTLAYHPGVYRILVTKGTATDCPADLLVHMTATGGALADASGTAQTIVPTTAFQGTNSVNSWTLVGYITNNVAQPTITFAYASGGVSRFHMDAVDFQSVDDPANPATPARITQILYSNTVTLSGTGPIGHPFALVSSTNAAKALHQWTREKTNTDATGTFSFSLTPGAVKAKFFRVITQ